MAALSSLQRRPHGMVYLEHEDSSSGEYPETGQHHRGHSSRLQGTGGSPHGSLPRCRTADSEDSYEEIYSSSEDDSYHSDCDDIAEYWDPYCTLH